MKLPGESDARYRARLRRNEEDVQATTRLSEPVDMHNDVTEGEDVYKLVEEAFYKGKTQGYGEGLRQGQVNSNDTIEELSHQYRCGGPCSIGLAVALIGIGAAVTFGIMIALGLI